MSIGGAFQMAGEIYILGIVIALGMAALIKLICFCINKSEQKDSADNGGGNS